MLKWILFLLKFIAGYELKSFHQYLQFKSMSQSDRKQVQLKLGKSEYGYLPDIVNPINANADRLYNIAASLAQAYDKLKRESQGHSKQVQAQVIRRLQYESSQARQAIINQKNQEKQYIRSLVEEERNLKNQFYNSYRNEERLRINANKRAEELERELNSIKAKASAAETSYSFTKAGGSVSEAQKKTILEIINKANISNRCIQIQKGINKALSGSWGVTTGLTAGTWESKYQWEKWLIFSSNKYNIFVWKRSQEVTPSQTGYQLSNSFGDVSVDQKSTAAQIINKHIFSYETTSNMSSNIEKDINAGLGGSWGVAIGLENSWCIKAPAQKWILYSSNLKSVFIWKNYENKAESKEEDSKKQEDSSLQSLVSLFSGLANKQQTKEENIEEYEEVSLPKNEPVVDSEFMLVDSFNSPGTESTYIRVLLDQLMLPTEDPFVRADWIRQLTQKSAGGTWGVHLNVPLADWASKQDYTRWYIYQKNTTQVLIWNRTPTETEEKPPQEQSLVPTEPQKKQEQVLVSMENV